MGDGVRTEDIGEGEGPLIVVALLFKMQDPQKHSDVVTASK